MTARDVAPPSFTYDDTAEYLPRLAPSSDLVLVCGQAVNFWAEFYRRRVPELDREGPFASKDTDFLGDRAAVEYCAQRLSGTVSLFDQRPRETVPCIGVITFLDANGKKQTIDILREVAGVDTKEIFDSAIEVRVSPSSSTTVWIMHPELCLESRVYNYMCLPDRRNDHVLTQLKASIICAREYCRDLLLRNQVRDVLNLNERVFRFCMNNHAALNLVALYGPDPFDAILVADGLPQQFLRKRYPMMRERLTARRDGWTKKPRVL